MSRAGSFIAVLTLALGCGAVSAQTVGRVSGAPLNLAPAGDMYSRTTRPAPPDRLEGVVRASYNQSSPQRTAAPVERLASNRTTNYGASNATPIQSLPLARNVPNYYPMSYSTSYGGQAGNYGPAYGQAYGQGYIRPTAYQAGAANQPPTLIPAAYQPQAGCGAPMTMPISAAPIPYAQPQAAPGARPFLPLTSMPNQVYVSRGLLGQPVVYVPGQPVRNALRYLAP